MRGFRHGHCVDGKTSRTYNAWVNMNSRCFNPKADKYRWYGGRGITVHDSWCRSFTNFLADMGECPPDLTLDRIDNNGNYEPGNCRWATWELQELNR